MAQKKSLKEEKKTKKKPEAAFLKEALVKSEKYQRNRDLLTAVLEEGKTYTTKETDAIIKKFMKGKVN